VRRFLHRETYAGRMRFGQQKKSAHKKSPPVVFNEVAVPAIVDADTWRLVQARLHEASNLTNRRAKRQYLLTGLIRCAICQRRCTGHTKVAYPPHRREYRYYQCLSRFTDKYEWCGGGVVPADQIDQAVWTQVESFIRNPRPVLHQLAERMGAVATGQFDLAREQARVERSRNATMAERNKLVGAIARGVLTDAEAAEQIEQIRLRLVALDEEDARLAQSADTEATNKAKLSEVEAILRALGETMDDIDFEGQRHIVRRLVKEIVLGRDDEDQPHAVITYAFSDPNRVLLIEMQEL
jgi:site-specific DNA recombinase